MPKQNNSAEGGSDLFEHQSTIQLYKFFEVPQIKMLCMDKCDKYFVFKKIFRTRKIFVTDEIQSRLRRITWQLSVVINTQENDKFRRGKVMILSSMN